jgi:hypothetical protein
MVGSWNKIKINIYYSFKGFSIKLDYVMIKIYVCIFLSYKLLHMMWSQGSYIFSFIYAEFWIGKCIYFLSLLHIYYVSMDVVFTSVWTAVFM